MRQWDSSTVEYKLALLESEVKNPNREGESKSKANLLVEALKST